MKQNSQFFVFNLFGNFIKPRDRPVWTHELIQLMQPLDIAEKTTRSTLARMRQKGWLTVEKVGRQSRYAMSDKGLELLKEGDQRIFEAPPETWDGRWHLVTYSLPETVAHLRNPLAKRLRWAGYGNLNRGTWLSPLDRAAQLQPILQELGIAEHVLLFADARKLGHQDDQALVAQCWDLNGLAAAYNEFVDHFRPLLAANQRSTSTLTEADATCAFQQHFWLAQAFQSFPRRDPNLPRALLPADWIGYEARSLFESFRAQLERQMQPFLHSIFEPKSTLPRLTT